MHPVLFEVAGYPIYAYGALGSLAFVVGTLVCLWRAHRLGLELNRFADLIFWMAVLSLLGARATFLLQNPAEMNSIGSILDLRGGGLVFYGSFAVGLPLGFFLMRRYGLPAFTSWDIFGTAFPLSHAISRLGCYASGCCYGSPTDGPLGVVYPPDSPIAPPDVALHPVQLYEAAGLVAIAVATNVAFARRAWAGQVFLLYLVLYAVLRAITEVFRGDPGRGVVLPALFGDHVSFSQGASGVVAVFGLAVFLGVARARSAAPSA